jgi:hypothetical protein
MNGNAWIEMNEWKWMNWNEWIEINEIMKNKWRMNEE